MLKDISSPEDLKKLKDKQLNALAGEIRQSLIETVNENGGHLASNLGMVEATIALHRVFSSPNDKILFDVGHQSYTHKLLTGRYENFHTLRKYGGVSGFQNREESEHDPMTQGHCGTSLSAALGIATANKLQGNDNYTVAVIGDGALTNGMIYEALDNCADRDVKLVILINDNNMSISGTVGGVHKNLARVRTSKGYFRFKYRTEAVLSKIPLLGKPALWLLRGVKNFLKRLFVGSNFFENLGFDYIGPVDGHNLKKLINVLSEAKRKNKCVIVHMRTQKGKGYAPAEEEPEKYHSVGKCNRETGETCFPCGFSEEAGKIALQAARENDKICAITAAMRDGVGLTEFSKEFPERFFDVGIAEEHAVTFAAGLAEEGYRPVLFLYSTFAQRGYDQLFHDVSLQKLSLTLMIDRFGIVPEDGVTHQGLYSYPLLSSVPGAKIYAPVSYVELKTCFEQTLSENGVSALCYPKGGETILPEMKSKSTLFYTEGTPDCDVVFVTYGRLTNVALQAARLLGEKRAGVVRLLRVFPLDMDEILPLVKNAKLVYILEEGTKEGGMGEKLLAQFSLAGVGANTCLHAAPAFLPHGSVKELYAECGFVPEEIAERVHNLPKQSQQKVRGIFSKRL